MRRMTKDDVDEGVSKRHLPYDRGWAWVVAVGQ